MRVFTRRMEKSFAVLGEKPLLQFQWLSSLLGTFIALFKCHIGRQQAPGLGGEKKIYPDLECVRARTDFSDKSELE